MWLFATLPLPAVHATGRALGWINGSLIRYRRRYILDTLHQSLPGRSAAEYGRIADGMYQNLSINTLEIARLAGGCTDVTDGKVTFEGLEHVAQARAAGKGALILTAHIGNFDLMGMYSAKEGFPLTIISKVIKNEALNEVWMKLRARFGVKIVLSHNSYRACLRVLKQNEVIGFILDTNRPIAHGVFVNFFGRPACTSPGLAFMSAQSKAPVIPAFIHREGTDRHVIRVLPPIPPPPDHEAPTILAATQEYTRIIEEEITRYPDQWLWLHKRWKTQPLPATSDPTPPPQSSAEADSDS